VALVALKLDSQQQVVVAVRHEERHQVSMVAAIAAGHEEAAGSTCVQDPAAERNLGGVGLDQDAEDDHCYCGVAPVEYEPTEAATTGGPLLGRRDLSTGRLLIGRVLAERAVTSPGASLVLMPLDGLSVVFLMVEHVVHG